MGFKGKPWFPLRMGVMGETLGLPHVKTPYYNRYRDKSRAGPIVRNSKSDDPFPPIPCIHPFYTLVYLDAELFRLLPLQVVIDLPILHFLEIQENIKSMCSIESGLSSHDIGRNSTHIIEFGMTSSI